MYTNMNILLCLYSRALNIGKLYTMSYETCVLLTMCVGFFTYPLSLLSVAAFSLMRKLLWRLQKASLMMLRLKRKDNSSKIIYRARNKKINTTKLMTKAWNITYRYFIRFLSLNHIRLIRSSICIPIPT